MTKTTFFRKDRLILATIFGTGIIPLFIGLFLFYNPQYLSGNTIERGELLTPPLDARPWLGEAETWRLVLLATDECLEECQQMIYFGRQAHEALKEERERRVSRVIIIREGIDISPEILEALENQSPPISTVYLDENDLQELFGSQFPNLDEINTDMFIVDPLGNLILRYEEVRTIAKAKALIKDINHLLRASRIG